MKWKLDRIISVATLITSLLALFLVLKRPAPVTTPVAPATAAANAQSFQDKLSQLEQSAQQPRQAEAAQSTAVPESESSAAPQSKPSPSRPAEVRITSDEVSAALAQAAGSLPAATAAQPDSSTSMPAGLDLSSAPSIKDQQVSFDGDVVHGQFLTEVAGKDVWITISGHLGSRDGYATFDPTEFKVGDLNVPVSLVNDALQKKLSEQKDRLKLPDYIGGIKVENGQLVLTQK